MPKSKASKKLGFRTTDGEFFLGERDRRIYKPF
jgi:hypothetical protein